MNEDDLAMQANTLKRIQDIITHIAWMDTVYPQFVSELPSDVVAEAMSSWTYTSDTCWQAFANNNLWVDGSALSLAGKLHGIHFGIISHPNYKAIKKLLSLGLYGLDSMENFGIVQKNEHKKWPMPVTWSYHS